MLIAIDISNIFLAFKYVKHYDIGQMLRSTFPVKFKDQNHDNSSVKNKMTIPIINKEENIMFKYHLNT